MSKQFWSLTGCLALVALLTSACQPGPAVTAEHPTVTPAPTEIALAGDYLGQTPPDSTPEVFAPGIVSVVGRYEYGLAVSPDGDEIFFTADDPGRGLMVVRRIDGRWTQPEVANLRGNDSWEFEAFYTVDGQSLFFASREAVDEGISKFWYVEKGPDGWGEAQVLDSPVNEAEVFWATFTGDGTMYYTNVDKIKIYRARQVDGAYPEVEDIGLPRGAHSSVAPDESFLLFNSSGLGGAGESDIFISFRQGDDTWGAPRNMGPEINTAYFETCPSLSPDGRYIFFSRYDEPDGKSNIYWVSSAIIERLRETDMPSPEPVGAVPSLTPQPGTLSLSFVESGQALGEGDLAIELGDLDGDGDLDAVTVYWNRPGKVWLNDGTGVFGDSGQSLVDGDSVALGDLDGDGDLDAFIGRGGSGDGLPSEVWLNDGTGTFSNSGQLLSNKVAMAVALDDVDGDGDLDAVIANFHNSRGMPIPNEVWLNDGTATFTDSGQRLGHAISDGVALGDLDQDGDTDILFTNTRGSDNEVWLNQGGVQGGSSGVFEVSDQGLGTGGMFALGDLDGDGDLDALQMSDGTSNGKVWLNDGAGAFSDSGQSLSNPGGAGTWWVALGDLDGDRDLDAFVACGDGRGLGDLPDTPNLIWLNDGTGVLSDSGLRLGNADSQEVALGDLDGDGDLDAFVVNSDMPGEVWLNETSSVE
jgi:hypothetical protein